jgi:hypothetical protein
MVQIFRCGIADPAFELAPNEFIRVEFRSIAGELLSMQSRTSCQEPLDGGRLVNWSAVPEKHNGAFKMAKQVPEESLNLSGRDVNAMEAKIEGHAMTFWGNG